jgi:hypothetical protein
MFFIGPHQTGLAGLAQGGCDETAGFCDEWRSGERRGA